MQVGFQTVSRCTLEKIVEIEKVELHLHLGGSWPLDYLREIADPKDFAALCPLLDRFKDGVEYSEAFEVFSLIGKIVNTEQKVEDGVVALCAQLAADKVVYTEIRTGLKDLGNGLEGYLNAVLRGMQRGAFEHGVTVALILSLRRDTSEEVAKKTIDLALEYREKGVVGIDLSGDSTKGDGQAAIQEIVRAKAHGLPVTLHIGESPDETPAQQMNELKALKPARIGHGVHLCEAARQRVLKKKIPLELCPTSAVQAKMIKKTAEHPGLVLLLEDHPVVICTDDPLLFKGVTLSSELLQVAEILSLPLVEVIQLQATARKHRFTKLNEIRDPS